MKNDPSAAAAAAGAQAVNQNSSLVGLYSEPNPSRFQEIGARAPQRGFLSCHRVNRSADAAAGDITVVLSIAVQHRADLETIRRALCRNGQGLASGALGVALYLIIGSATQ
jgi:hypothetical protein